MFQLLARLGEAKLVRSMLERLIAQPNHAQADNSAILDALGVLCREHAAERLKAIVEAHGVVRCAAQWDAERSVRNEAQSASSRG
jgi:hypothetical protein